MTQEKKTTVYRVELGDLLASVSDRPFMMVRAKNSPLARRFVTDQLITVTRASQDDIIDAMNDGIEIENAHTTKESANA